MNSNSNKSLANNNSLSNQALYNQNVNPNNYNPPYHPPIYYESGYQPPFNQNLYPNPHQNYAGYQQPYVVDGYESSQNYRPYNERERQSESQNLVDHCPFCNQMT